ncbi:MAG: RNA polymerase sigma factor [Gammaproteobacteria bacterium]
MLTVMAGGSEDAQLMTRYVTGDVAAFETLYARHRGPLYRYFLRQCGHADTADELFQDVWMSIIKARARYEPKARFTTYMYQIAHNRLVDHFRKSGRDLTRDSAPTLERTGAPASGDDELDPTFASARWSLVDWDAPADGASGPEATLSGEQRAERLWTALDALPIEQREAFLLHEEAELGLAEIATVTGAKAETVKSRLRYAVKKLRTSLGDLAPAGARDAVS